MLETPQESRPVYRPTSKVRWLIFLPGLVLTATAAIAMAWCLWWAFARGFYWILFAPLVASFPVVGIWYLVLRWSHCRSRFLAAAASAALGLLLYLGYYQIGLIQEIGLQNAHRVDLLPQYVQLRMQTDELSDDMGRPAQVPPRPHEPGLIAHVFKWFFFIIEVVVVVSLFLTIAQRCGSRAYCELCGRWMKSEKLNLPPGLGVPLWVSLEAGNHADVHDRLSTMPPRSGLGCTLIVEHCPACATAGRSPPVYLTMVDFKTPGQPQPKLGSPSGPRFSLINQPGTRTLVDHAALRPAEVAVLAPSFPALNTLLAAHPALFADARSRVAEIARERPAPAAERPLRVARIQPVSALEAGIILTRRNAIVAATLGSAAPWAALVIAAVPPLLLLLYTFKPSPPPWVFGVLAVWIVACLGLIGLAVLYFRTYLPGRFMLRQTCRALARRAAPAVDLHDPDLFFVEIVPRVNWAWNISRRASDTGFLELSAKRRELIFEGDRQRYWIPAECILEIKHEFWAEPLVIGHQFRPTLHHLVLVKAMTADGPWETWFSRPHTRFRRHTPKRELNDALELEARIRELTRPAP